MIYLQLFFTFFKIGAFTFGGGYAMLPLIQEEVLSHGWMTLDELVNFVAVSESTPGPFAINISTYVGTETGGILGAVCATFGVVLPSLIIILIVAKCYLAFKNSRIVKGCMSGLRPVTVGLIGAAVITIGQTVFFAGEISPAVLQTAAFWGSLVIFAGCTVLSFKKWHPITIVALSAAAGIAFGYAGAWG